MAKIVLIGVGSVCFGVGTIADLLFYKDDLAGSTISLVDIDGEKLSLVRNIANELNKRAGMPFCIESSTERRDVLGGADYVITSPAIKREELWKKEVAGKVKLISGWQRRNLNFQGFTRLENLIK